MTTVKVNISGGGGGGGEGVTWISNGVVDGYSWYPYPSSPNKTGPLIGPARGPITVTPFPELTIPGNPFQTNEGRAKLTPAQMDYLLREHPFMPMEQGQFCLFCYALDTFRTEADHIFVISEE